MNETEHKYYVYTQNGLLINRVNFRELVNQYGEPVAASSNGLNFMLRKKMNRKSKENMSLNKVQKEMFTISMVNMSIFGIEHIKDINLLESKELKDTWVSKLNAKELLSKVKIEIRISDSFDVCVQISAIEKSTVK